MRRKAEQAPNWDDARLAIQEIGGWIKNADAKVTILGAGVGVLFGATASRLQIIVEAYRVAGAFSAVFLLLAILLAVSFLGVGGSVYWALRPRTSHVPRNRFAWPALANVAPEELDFDSESVAGEAWLQARDLANIAKRKYGAFGVGLKFFGFSLLAFGGLIVWAEALH